MSRCSVGDVRPTRARAPAAASFPATAAKTIATTMAATLATTAVAALGGCGDSGEPPRCVTVDAACTPRYEPTFSNVYNNTLRDSCGSQSSVCHSAQGRRGGLSLESSDVAYAQLTAEGLGRVVPGDPACSEMIVRLHGDGEGYLMPPGAPLPAADRCAIERWIASGAMPSNLDLLPSAPLAARRGDGASP